MKTKKVNEHKEQTKKNIQLLGKSKTMKKMGINFINKSAPFKYSYNFTWMGRPIIQYPQDIMAMQEIIWNIKPDLIIETGIAHGGSLVFYASMLALLDIVDAMPQKDKKRNKKSRRKVIGIDIDIREQNRIRIENHPMSNYIQMIEGSSIDDKIIYEVYQIATKYKCILVCLDSNHTYDHVISELEAYSPLVTLGSYCIVFDTIIEFMPKDSFPNRPWGLGNNPMTAVSIFVKTHPEFEIDNTISDKLLITVSPNGFLKKILEPFSKDLNHS